MVEHTTSVENEKGNREMLTNDLWDVWGVNMELRHSLTPRISQGIKGGG